MNKRMIWNLFWMATTTLLFIVRLSRAEQVCADLAVELSTGSYLVPTPIPTSPTKAELWTQLKRAEYLRDLLRLEWLRAVESNMTKDQALLETEARLFKIMDAVVYVPPDVSISTATP